MVMGIRAMSSWYVEDDKDDETNAMWTILIASNPAAKQQEAPRKLSSVKLYNWGERDSVIVDDQERILQNQITGEDDIWQNCVWEIWRGMAPWCSGKTQPSPGEWKSLQKWKISEKCKKT